ncbi:MAG: hypothetical protein GY937_09410 [bacterium]|nr:hypothetical protein [bacterium]
MESEQGLQIGDLVGVLKRRIRLVVGVGAVITSLALLVAAWLPNTYESKAVLLIQPQSISSNLVESNLQETDLNSRLHLIQMQILSRSRLSQVVSDLDVYPEMSKTMPREEIIEKMREEVSVVPLLSELEAEAGIRNRDVQITTFLLSFRHRQRQMASDVANKLARSFVEEHIKDRTRESSVTSEFIEAELTRLSDRIRQVDAQIATVKGESTGSLPEDIQSNQRLHERLIQQLRQAQRDLTLAESDEAFYRQQVAAGGTDNYMFTGNRMTPERRLETLRLAIGEYESRGYTAKHPDMVHTQAEIAELELQASEVAEGESETLSMGQQNAKAEQQRAALRAASARSDLATLGEQLAAIEDRLSKTPQVQARLSSLEREYEHLFGSFQEYSEKQLAASVAADMERRQQGERFRLLEEAVPADGLASPNRPVIILVGLIFGMGLGLAAALLAEANDRSFHDPGTLQERLGIPVLASVPEVILASDRALARRQRFRTAILASVVTGTVLVVSLAGNWYVNGLPGVLQDLRGGGEETAAPSPSE